MSGAPTAAGPARASPRPMMQRAGRVLRGIEDAVIVLALAGMVLLPLLEIVLRRAGSIGISGSTAFVQHGTLVVGLIGAAIAARQNRLLSLSTAQMLPAGRLTALARIVSGTAAAGAGALLCAAAVELVGQERQYGRPIAYGVRAWVLQLAMPAGFALITLRVVWHSADGWVGRTATALLAGALLAALRWSGLEPSGLVWPALGGLLLALALGAPIFAILGGAALILFWGEGSPLGSIAVDHYRLVTNPSLPTIPLFTLAGYLLAEGGASKRLVRLFEAWFGWLRGGPAVVTVAACAFFTSFTGASGVTILALGGLLMPILLAARYTERAALGLLTGAGSLGMLFPPCLPLILYAIIASQPIERIFLAAVGPGLLMLVMTAALGVWLGPRRGSSGAAGAGEARAARVRFVPREALRSLWVAKWELLLPVVCLVSLFGGFATPVEASAITALYAFVSQALIWRDLRMTRDVPRAMVECGLVVGGVLLILGVAQGFTNYLVFAQVPDRAVDWATTAIHSPLVFLLFLNLFLLVVGCLMDVYSAIVVVVPLIVPIGAAFDVDPLHLGVIFLANLELGYLTPPVGMNLFLSSYRFGKPLAEVCRSIVPVLLIQLIAVLLITYVPPLTTVLPRLLDRP